MARHQNEIDKAFRDRFEGLKDHSQNVDLGWMRLESELDSTIGSTGQEALGNGVNASAWLKAAASVAGIALITAAYIQFSSPSSIVNESKGIESDGDSPALVNETLILTAGKPSMAGATGLSIEDASQNDVNTGGNRPESKPLDSDHSIIASSNDGVIKSNSNNVSVVTGSGAQYPNGSRFEAESGELLTGQSQDTKRNLLALNLMDRFKAHEYQASILERTFPKIEDPTIDAWNKSFTVYARIAARTGTGESNSYEVKASPKLNPLLSIGVGYALSDRSFITAELGWLRKSGNGIERAKQMDVSGFVNSISGNNTNDINQLVVHEGLIATRIDYLHIPVAYHQMLSNLPVLSDKWNVSLGGYSDILLTADNQAYIIYNSEEYKLNPVNKVEKSVVGLNRTRFGFFTGIERQLSQRIVVNATITFPPLNSAVNASSEYQEFDQANKPLDIQLGLKFHL